MAEEGNKLLVILSRVCIGNVPILQTIQRKKDTLGKVGTNMIKWKNKGITNRIMISQSDVKLLPCTNRFNAA